MIQLILVRQITYSIIVHTKFLMETTEFYQRVYVWANNFVEIRKQDSFLVRNNIVKFLLCLCLNERTSLDKPYNFHVYTWITAITKNCFVLEELLTRNTICIVQKHTSPVCDRLCSINLCFFLKVFPHPLKSHIFCSESQSAILSAMFANKMSAPVICIFEPSHHALRKERLAVIDNLAKRRDLALSVLVGRV